ncbi:MAG: calcium/sodium antiporter [Lachnospiraceae bacterium]|nr:calcium/sodium antiporter [Lachnospiraceae bacterium]
MTLLINILLLLVGFVALIKGADLFVDGSSSLAKIFKVPGVIIGLTIVAMGTSAPELAVSVSAAIKGSNEIAMSNVIGSNIFNLLSVLGVCALIHPLPVDKAIMKRDFPILMGITALIFLGLAVPALSSGNLNGARMADNVSLMSRPYGIVLLLIFIAYLSMLIISALKNPHEEEGGKSQPLWKCIIFIIIGLICIVKGGDFVVNGAKYIASTFGMSETLIGLTIVAVGTSLPELVTSIVASRKGQNDLAAGNVVGSNIFNFLLILGSSSAIHPIAVNLASLTDLAILMVLNIIVFAFAKTQNISRVEGGILVAIYVSHVIFAILR